MKLFDFRRKNDFGVELYFTLLRNKKYCLFQTSVSYSDYSSWPYLQITMGQNSLIGFFCYAWKIGFDFDILGRTWRL